MSAPEDLDHTFPGPQLNNFIVFILTCKKKGSSERKLLWSWALARAFKIPEFYTGRSAWVYTCYISNSTFLLVSTQGGSRWWLRNLGCCHSCTTKIEFFFSALVLAQFWLFWVFEGWTIRWKIACVVFLSLRLAISATSVIQIKQIFFKNVKSVPVIYQTFGARSNEGCWLKGHF